ncbi:hypothetical protein C0J52_05915, partial [Blattella germanica]
RTYFELKSITGVQRRFRNEFNIAQHGRIPSQNIILKLVCKFNNSGKSVHLKTLRELEKMCSKSPTSSAMHHSMALNISDRSFCHILHSDLKFLIYKIQILQDKLTRLQFCRHFIGILNANPDILNRLIMSDKAHFHLSGYTNKQNYCYWSDEPFHIMEKPIHSPKVTV